MAEEATTTKANATLETEKEIETEKETVITTSSSSPILEKGTAVVVLHEEDTVMAPTSPISNQMMVPQVARTIASKETPETSRVSRLAETPTIIRVTRPLAGVVTTI